MNGISDELRAILEAKQDTNSKPHGRGRRTHKQEFFRGDRMRQLRDKWSLTQGEMADLLGCVRPTVANLENGWQEPSLSIVVKMATHFGVTSDWLLGIGE